MAYFYYDFSNYLLNNDNYQINNLNNFDMTNYSITPEPTNINNTLSVENQCNDSPARHILFQAANIFFLVSYLAPNGKYCILLMHTLLIVGFLLYSTWAWNIICAPGVFSWNFCLMLINMGQTFYLLYNMRQVKFNNELEEIYEHLFEPMQISRLLFKKLVSSENAQIVGLQPGEAYATENLTRSDRLSLLISGRINVLSNNNYLHSIEPKQFLDSPEFESSKTGKEEKFNVSIIAELPSKCILWQRQTLDYLLIKETFLANVLNLILARDITHKLYSMNEKIVTEKGTHLDIRLPSITTSLCNSATSLNESNENDVVLSPVRPKLGLRVKDRNITIRKGSRSKSLQTNSLGLAVSSSPRIIQRTAAMKFSPKRESLDPTIITLENNDSEIIDISPTHGVRFKINK